MNEYVHSLGQTPTRLQRRARGAHCRIEPGAHLELVHLHHLDACADADVGLAVLTIRRAQYNNLRISSASHG